MQTELEARISRSTSLRRWLTGLTVLGLTLALAACGGPADPDPADGASPSTVPSITAPSASPASPGSPKPSVSSEPSVAQPSRDQVVVDITVSGNQVTPNGEKLDVPVGATVKLNVTSDADDEIHAHTGGDGYELEVKAGGTARGQFVADEPGSFEVESHHLGKVIVVLNVR